MSTLKTSPTTTYTSDRRLYIYIATMSATLNLTIVAAPLLAVKLGSDLGFTAGESGLLLSVELGAFSLATIPAFLWLRRLNLRTATFLFGAVAIVGNVASMFATTLAPLAGARLVTALAAGSIIVIVLSLAGKAKNSARAFGLFALMQVLMGGLVFAFFPTIFEPRPIAAVYLTMGALVLLSLPVATIVPRRILMHDASDAGTIHEGASNLVKYFVALASVLLWYIAAAGVYTFVAQVALDAGIDIATTSYILAIATAAGIAPSLLATFVGDSRHSKLFIMGSFLVFMVGVFLLLGMQGAMVFAIAVILFVCSWNFLAPYLFAMISTVHHSPHAMSALNLVMGGGFAIGPVLAGNVLQQTGSNDAMLWGGLLFTGVGMACAAFVLWGRSKTPGAVSMPVALTPRQTPEP